MKKNFLLKLSVVALSLIAFICLAATHAKAQAFSTLYSFNSGTDGAHPYSGLIMDSSGNLYGTTYGGGSGNSGTFFELVNSSGTYTEKVLHTFTNSPSDGFQPYGDLVMDSSGNFYGTTTGGGASGAGTFFELTNSSGAYTEKVLYSFGSVSGDGSSPNGLVMDSSGNLYGGTYFGGSANSGTVFELVNSSGTYSEKVLYNFTGYPGDGAHMQAALIVDSSGNLYGTTQSGGPNNVGIVFELVNSSGTYSEKVLYNFTGSGNDGATPQAGLVMDSSGNLYGTTQNGGASGLGTVFELVNSSGTYSEKVLYSFTGGANDGANPYAGVIMDSSGDLFGTTAGGGTGAGTVFELINSSGTYTEVPLLFFGTSCGGNGQAPLYGGLVMDVSGNLYGTTANGGANSDGTVFSLTHTTNQTATTLTSSANPVSAGVPVVFTASILNASVLTPPSGSVTFSEGGTVLGTIGTTPGSCNSATSTLVINDAEALGIGSYSVTAQFVPSGSSLASGSATISQTVNEAGVVLTSGSNTFNGNQSVNGSLAATSFSGNGSGLLNLNPASLGPGTAGINITGSAAMALVAASLSGSILESQVNNLTTDLAGKVPLASIGAASGVASLDATGKVPAAQLPAVSAGIPAILVGSCTGAASSTKGSTFAFEGLGALANETCGNAVSTSTAVGIPMSAAGTLSGLNVYPGSVGNGGTAVTFTVYKAAAPGWTVSSGANQTTLSAVSFSRSTRRVTLTVASGTNFAAGNTITVSGITGTYNAGTNCTAESGALFDGTFTVAANTATAVVFTDTALPSNCGSNINNAAATGTVADTTNPTYSTATRTAPVATNLTCTIGALTTSASAVCSDTSDTVAVNPGDLISVIATSSRASGTETLGEIRVTLQKQ